MMVRSARMLLALVTSVAGCTPPAAPVHEVLITGAEYTFVHPDTLASGPTVFRFVNAGKVRHEMNLGRLKPGVTLAQALAAGPKGGELFESWGAILIAAPGDTVPGRVLIDLVPGATYVLWCNFHDSAGAPAHATLGMTASLAVK